MEDRKIRIAFVKYGGASAGGTEKFLQTIAANLPKDKFDVDYYYCDLSKFIGVDDIKLPATDRSRIDYLEKHGVNLIKFHVDAVDLRTVTYRWVNTDFWQVFNETNYDLIQSGRAGHKEYP